jgi:ATP-binding protein involved in chromosome partitioning
LTVDPRTAGVDARLAGARRILAVTGGKGGTGKSLVATLLALAWADAGRRVGLLDLDLTAPTDHVFLGLQPRLPDEPWGVEPPRIGGLHFMSMSCFGGPTPAPLRGLDVSNALLELLAITRWPELDVLVVDMPPGLGDALLDAARHLRRAEHLAVATASPVVLETVRRTLALLQRLGLELAGVVENMRRAPAPAVPALAARFDLPLLGTIPFDDRLEPAIGDPAALRRTRAFDAVRELARALPWRA